MPIENTMTDVQAVFAMEGLKLNPEPLEAPVAITEPPLDEIEALRADVMANGSPELLQRFETVVSGLAQSRADFRALLRGYELHFVVSEPDAAKAFFDELSPEDQAAFSETLRVQYALAMGSPAIPGGDGRLELNPFAVNPPTLGGSDNALRAQG